MNIRKNARKRSSKGSSFSAPSAFAVFSIAIILAVIPLAAFLVYLPSAGSAGAQSSTDRFDVKLSSNVYAPGDTVILYGKVIPDDALVIRLFDPSGKVLRLDTLKARSDGTFTEQVFVWPQPSKQYAFGTYSIEVRSSIVPSDIKTLQVFFVDVAGTGFSSSVPSSADLVVKLDAPALVSTNSQFRIFVQVTYDGALVNADSDEELDSLLGSSHIHFGDSTDSTIINLSGRFYKLHEGLYYADVALDRDGSYIIHSIAFHKGFLSHDSRVVVASSASIGSVQESVNRLNERLDTTNRSLDQTNASLDTTRNALTQFVEETRFTMGQMRDASGQINGLILPILVLISIIIALQISLFARIRASYR